jgi:hypothetical protein
MTGGGSMNDLERIKDRVRKLLALSKSDNENEAAAALEKANELIGKYRIDQDSLAFESVSVKTTKTYSPWRNIIANAVSYLYGCYKYKNTEGEFVFTGDPLYVFMAEEMYRYLTVTVERIAKAGIRRNAKYAYRQNFRLGVADRLYDRIMELNKKCSWAPEREAQSEAAEDFIKARIKLSSTAHRHKIKKRTAFNKGIAAGEGISLARQAGHSPVPQLASGRTARTVQGELF